MRRIALLAVLGLVLLMPVGASRPGGGVTAANGVAPRESLAVTPDTTGGASIPDSLSAAADSAAATTPPAPPRDYLAEVRANFSPENRAYAGIRVLLAFIEPALVLLAMLVLLFSGLSARLRDIARNLGHRLYVQVLVYFALFSVLTFAVMLPLEWYRGFALEHQYGLSNESFLGWFLDELKSLGFTIALIGVVPLLALAYRALRRRPRTWWLWLGAASVPLIVILTLLSPIVFDPAFNRFSPLQDQSLKREIIDLASRAGIPGRNVYEVNKSEQTKKFNAYVSGFGASQRIVLWDTILKGMERDELLFVMGHEMGHYRLHHIWWGIAFLSLQSLLMFFLAGQIVGRALPRFGPQWHVEEVHDIATLPLFVITLTVLSLAMQPLSAAFSRTIEHDADVFALEVTRDNDAGARAFLKLGAQNRNDPEPSPVVRAVLYDHPPLAERIRFALDYRPWERGAANRLYRPVPSREP